MLRATIEHTNYYDKAGRASGTRPLRRAGDERVYYMRVWTDYPYYPEEEPLFINALTGQRAHVDPGEMVEVCQWRFEEIPGPGAEGIEVDEPTTILDLDDMNNPAMRQAIDLCRRLREHCLENNLPREAVIFGVAWDYDSAERGTYQRGVGEAIDAAIEQVRALKR